MNPQIPTIQPPSHIHVKGQAQVSITSRSGPGVAGTFNINVDVGFDPAVNDYPTMNPPVNLRIENIRLTDSIQGTAVATVLFQLTSIGTATPTAWISGRCNFDPSGPVPAPGMKGCLFWLMIANNRGPRPSVPPGTPDVVSFVILDKSGTLFAYGTGPVVAGDLQVGP